MARIMTIAFFIVVIVLIALVLRHNNRQNKKDFEKYSLEVGNSIDAVFSSIQFRTKGTTYNIDSLKRYVYDTDFDDDDEKFDKLVKLQDSIRRNYIRLSLKPVRAYK